MFFTFDIKCNMYIGNLRVNARFGRNDTGWNLRQSQKFLTFGPSHECRNVPRLILTLVNPVIESTLVVKPRKMGPPLRLP